MRILRLKDDSTLSNISPVIQAFFWLKYLMGRVLLIIPRKHLGFSDFQITTGASLSPAALTRKATVTLCFDFLPPRHFFPFSPKLLSGRALQKHPVSSKLYIYPPFYSPSKFLAISLSRNLFFHLQHLPTHPGWPPFVCCNVSSTFLTTHLFL